MSWNYAKKPRKEPTLTDADCKRIAAIDQNPWTVGRKCKYQLTLANPKQKAVISITIYGKDVDEIKEKIVWHQHWFDANSKGWKIVEAKNVKVVQEADCESHQ